MAEGTLTSALAASRPTGTSAPFMSGSSNPFRPSGRGAAWHALVSQHEQIRVWLDQGLALTKFHTLLGRRRLVVSYRTLHRYATTELGSDQRRATEPVLDGEPDR